ncbi:unnamed protein product [Protopolystoma xenopodis]|uniref:Uncharacterized protein n=1 Tax=Protopolystoma xenopodis TaxID=117903 RepID=A0A3S4ZG84_9PLAT|nr:unnamed protein product [Protopolystoma xenopodis]
MRLLPELESRLHSRSALTASANKSQHQLHLLPQQTQPGRPAIRPFESVPSSSPPAFVSPGADCHSSLSLADNEAMMIVAQAQVLAKLATNVRCAQLDRLLTWLIALETIVLPESRSLQIGTENHYDSTALSAILRAGEISPKAPGSCFEAMEEGEVVQDTCLADAREYLYEKGTDELRDASSGLQPNAWEVDVDSRTLRKDYENVDLEEESPLVRLMPPRELLDLCRLVVSFAKYSSIPPSAVPVPGRPTELPSSRAIAMAARVLEEADNLLMASKALITAGMQGQLAKRLAVPPAAGKDFSSCSSSPKSSAIVKGLPAGDSDHLSKC